MTPRLGVQIRDLRDIRATDRTVYALAAPAGRNPVSRNCQPEISAGDFVPSHCCRS